MKKRTFQNYADFHAWTSAIEEEYRRTGMNLEFHIDEPTAYPVVVVYTEEEAYLTADHCGAFTLYDCILVEQSDFLNGTE